MAGLIRIMIAVIRDDFDMVASIGCIDIDDLAVAVLRAKGSVCHTAIVISISVTTTIHCLSRATATVAAAPIIAETVASTGTHVGTAVVVGVSEPGGEKRAAATIAVVLVAIGRGQLMSCTLELLVGWQHGHRQTGQRSKCALCRVVVLRVCRDGHGAVEFSRAEASDGRL
jgi:hypothetical protein